MKILTTYKIDSAAGPNAQKKRQKPFEQGRLDAFCGAYCLVNTVHYLYGPLSTDKAQRLLAEIVRHLNQHNDVIVRLVEGTGTTEIACALDNVIAKQYQIYRQMPFRCKKVKLNIFWSHMQEFLENNHGIVLLGIYDHWTLVKRVTDKSLILFDSDRMVRINRSHCTTDRKHNGSKYILYPARTYYIWTD